MVMDTLAININWEFFLGLLGSLIAIIYYASGCCTAHKTDVEWLREATSELLIRAENIPTKLLKYDSQVSLSAAGYHILRLSGLKSYIDTKRKTLLAALNAKALSGPYDVQRHAFRLFAKLSLEEAVGQHLKSFAYNNGISTDLLRRVGAIYLRDIAAGH